MKPTVIKLNNHSIRTRKKKPNQKPKIIISIIGGIFVVLLSTIGIDAADHFGNLSDSIVGRVLFGKTERCPSDMVFVQNDTNGFCVDKYENSAGDSCNIKSPSSVNETQTNIDNPSCKAVSIAKASPWTNITQDQSIRICAKSGKRLPTNNEWAQAAMGTFDINSSWSGDDCNVAGNWSVGVGQTGFGSKCLSYAGAYDMVGNVWEWVNGAITDGLYEGRKMPPAGYIKSMNANDNLPSETGDIPDTTMYNDNFWLKESGTRGILRGGYWDSKSDAGQYSVYAVEYPRSFGPTIGFRCVK